MFITFVLKGMYLNYATNPNGAFQHATAEAAKAAAERLLSINPTFMGGSVAVLEFEDGKHPVLVSTLANPPIIQLPWRDVR